MTALLLALCLLLSAPARAEPEPEPRGAHAWFTDVLLTDQDGRTHRLYTDLMKGRTVVVQAFFATCESVCPVTQANLAAIAETYRDRLGEDLLILSITVDPAKDSPGKLKAHADKLGVGPGWYLLTGGQAEVDLANGRFGQQVADPEAHNPLLLIGNDRTGLWKKAMGMGDRDELIRIVGTVLDDTGAEAAP